MIIKACGITCSDDAHMAFDSGVDWVGLNLVEGPRRIELSVAEKIATSIDDPARLVILIGTSAESVPGEALDRLAAVGVRRLQVYVQPVGRARETSRCLCLLVARGFETIAVQPVTDAASFVDAAEVLSECGDHPPNHVLLDAAVAGRLGGTGCVVDWELIAEAKRQGQFDGWPPVLLAGGLNPTNVAAAIRLVRPAGVDVCSGVESAPGRKDAGKLRSLVAAVRGNG